MMHAAAIDKIAAANFGKQKQAYQKQAQQKHAWQQQEHEVVAREPKGLTSEQ